MKQFFSMVAVIILAIALFICAPFIFIWALNTLFSLHIPYTLTTWSAAVVLYYSFSRPSKFSATKDKE